MQTIEFVLRSRVGSFQEGSLTGESGNTTIFLQTGDQVSLHLARHQVAGYEREGSNLIVKLADGREIVSSDYFAGDAGDQPRVFLSSNGEIVEVGLHTGEKTVLQYLLKPLYKSREAFREP